MKGISLRKIITSLTILSLIFSENIYALTLPTDVVNSVFHLDAQDVNGNGSTLDQPANGSAVTTWGDPFGAHSGSQSVVAQKPTYQTNIINGYPTIRFAGVNDILEMQDHFDINLGISYTEKSFAFLVRTGIDVLSHQVIYDQSVQSKGYSLQVDNGNLYFGTWNTDLWTNPNQYKIINLGPVSSQTAYRVVISQNTTMSGYLNGTFVGNATNVGIQTAHGQCTFNTSFDCSLFQTGGSIGIGGTQNDTLRLSNLSTISTYQNNFFTGDIGEMIEWNHALTPAEAVGIDEYLKSHWGFDTVPPMITSENAASGTLAPSGNFTYQFSYTDTGSSINTSSVKLAIYSWNTGSLTWNTTNLAPSYSTPGTITSSTGIFQIQNLPYGKYRFDRIISDTNNNQLTSSSTIFVDAIEWTISSPIYDIGGQQTDIAGFGSGELLITVKTVGAGFSLDMQRTQDLTLGTGSITVWNGTNGWGYELYNGAYSGTLAAHGTNQILGTVAKSINPNGEKNTYTYRVKYGMKASTLQEAGDYIGKLKFGINLTY